VNVAVDIRDLSFRYRGGTRHALSGVSLSLSEGSFTTVTGPSGGGKSTLCLAMAGFIPHSIAGEMTGEVLIGGLDTRSHSPVQLLGTIGMVRQDPEAQLCTLTVMDEVAFGLENLKVPAREIEGRVMEALKTCRAEHLAQRDVYSLSGGEKQRVAIASILVLRPKVIVLDEPTANLDPSGTRAVLDTLSALKKTGTAIMVVEHRLRHLARLSDRLIRVENGNVFEEQGRPLVQAARRIAGRIVRTKDETGSQGPPLLSIRDLCAGYGQRKVLQDVSLEIRPGEIVALMGDNGSGKSTLLSTIMGLIEPTGGSIALGGAEAVRTPVRERAGFVGLSFQNPNYQVSESTVSREIMLTAEGLGKSPSGRLQEITERFGLAGLEDRSPFSLSMGQKKRLNMTSLLVYDRKLLLLDEPFTGQDPDMVSAIAEELAAHVRQGGATLMVCHDPELVQAMCSRVIFLQDGCVAVDADTDRAFEALREMGRHEFTPFAAHSESEFDEDGRLGSKSSRRTADNAAGVRPGISPRVLGFQPGHSFLHSLNPLCKAFLLVLITVLAFSASGISRQAVLSASLVLGAALSGAGFDRFRRRLRVLTVFSATVLLAQMFFFKQGTPIPLFSLGRVSVVVWSQGLVRGIGLALRFLNVIFTSFLFVVTTDPNHLAYSLMQAGLPYRYGFMLVVALRFIPIFGYEMVQVRNAQLSKGIDVGSAGLKSLPRYVKYTVMPLVISALEKVDNLTISMEGRAFGLYRDRTYRVSFAITWRDWVATLFITGIISGLWAIV
jgi:energy-coupling factor transporter ATP-binding protein EcfA2/energy-coupling factor transporter transmembrane protein EcfT